MKTPSIARFVQRMQKQREALTSAHLSKSGALGSVSLPTLLSMEVEETLQHTETKLFGAHKVQ